MSWTFRSEQTADLDRGWPHYHVLIEDELSAEESASLALAQLEGIDPVWSVRVPRSVADAYLHLYRHVGTHHAHGKARRAEVGSTGAADQDTLVALLHQVEPDLGPTYLYKVESAFWLLEALLGTDAVADAIVARLVAIQGEYGSGAGNRDGRQWDNLNFHHFKLARVLASLCPRIADWSACTAPLSTCSGSAPFPKMLQGLAARTADWPARLSVVGVALGHAPRGPHGWDDVRHMWLAGAEVWASTPRDELPRLPKWMQQRVVVTYGVLRHAATVQTMLWILRGLSARSEAHAWLVQHDAFARPVLEDLVEDAMLGPSARSYLAGDVPDTVTLTYDDAEAMVDTAIRQLVRDLPKADDDMDRERALIRTAFDLYCAARSAAGDPIPPAYFGHQFVDVDWDCTDAQFERWFDLINEVQG